MVRRDGVDRRLSRSQRFLLAHPLLQFAVAGDVELGLVLQPARGEDGGRGRRNGAVESGRRTRCEVPCDLSPRDAGCAVDPHLPREAIYDAYCAHGRAARIVQRPHSHPGTLHRGAVGAMSYPTIHKARHHFGWNNAFEPVLRVAPGDTVVFEVVDASGGARIKTSPTKDVAPLLFARGHSLAGPACAPGGRPP